MPTSEAKTHEQDLIDLASRITLVGRDGNTLQFSCPSFTGQADENGELVTYQVELDMDARECRCSCPDAVCRKKRWHFHVPTSHGCKHVECLRRYVVPVLRGSGLI